MIRMGSIGTRSTGSGLGVGGGGVAVGVLAGLNAPQAVSKRMKKRASNECLNILVLLDYFEILLEVQNIKLVTPS
jgi:hypothetical protein